MRTKAFSAAVVMRLNFFYGSFCIENIFKIHMRTDGMYNNNMR